MESPTRLGSYYRVRVERLDADRFRLTISQGDMREAIWMICMPAAFLGEALSTIGITDLHSPGTAGDSGIGLRSIDGSRAAVLAGRLGERDVLTLICRNADPAALLSAVSRVARHVGVVFEELQR